MAGSSDFVTYLTIGQKGGYIWYERTNPNSETDLYMFGMSGSIEDVYEKDGGNYVYQSTTNVNIGRSAYLKIIDDLNKTEIAVYDSKIQLDDKKIAGRDCNVYEYIINGGKHIYYIDKDTNLRLKWETYLLVDGNYEFVQSIEVTKFSNNPRIPNAKPEK